MRHPFASKFNDSIECLMIMPEPSPKHRVLAGLAGVARALGNEHRLEIIEHLAQGERSVEALAAMVGLPVANASQHLQQLRRGGVVVARREGRQIVYRLADGPVVGAVSLLRQIAELNLAEVRTVVSDYYSNMDALEPVTNDELLLRLQSGTAMLLDVRPQAEFDAGHIPGALNLPLATLEARIAEIGREREIVAYCRGPYCILSFEAVRLLRGKGYRVRRLDLGFPEWRAEGRPIETGSIESDPSRGGPG